MVIRQSTYWITGSFNYIYPIFMLVLYWYILLKFSKTNFYKKDFLLLIILAFLASATVEQGGVMAFGLTILFFIYNIIIKRTVILKKLGFVLLSSLIGILSVICSPAQFTRFGLETSESFSLLSSVKNGFNFLIYVFIKSDLYRPHILLLLLTVFISFITLKKSQRISHFEIFLLLTTFILGTGSQIMMLVSPVFGERNTLFAGFMIILFTAILINHLPKFKNKLFIFSKICFYFSLIVISTLNIYNIYTNYKITNNIQIQNEKLITEYKKTNSTEKLELYKLPDDNYGWSMPYISDYHNYCFKIYYDIPNAEIIWKDYEK